MAAGDSTAATAHNTACTACLAALYRPRRIRSGGTTVYDPTYAAALTASNAAATATASGSATYAEIPRHLATLNKVKVLYSPVTTVSNVMRRRYLRIAMYQHKRLAYLHSIAP